MQCIDYYLVYLVLSSCCDALEVWPQMQYYLDILLSLLVLSNEISPAPGFPAFDSFCF